LTTLVLERDGSLTTEESAQLARNAVAARRCLIPFAQWTMPRYAAGEHHRLIAEHLEAVERGDLKRLLILAPPQHGKSELCSIRFPAWALCRNPERRIITASYGDVLAHGFGRAVRNCLDSQEAREIFPDVSVAPDSKAANLWHTNQGGRLLAVSIGGGITGHGADILNIDDPVKSREEAESQVYRDKVWAWWKAEAYTRVAAEGAIVITLTPWHEDDLAGRIQAEGVEPWTVLRLPALAEAGDPLSRIKGDPLWPERYPLNALERIRNAVGQRDWAALYQCRPSPIEGAVFQWWPRYETLPALKEILMPIDTAYTGGATSDYTAWAGWGVDANGKAYAVEAGRFKGEIPDAERQVFLAYQSLRQRFPTVPVKPLVRVSVAIDRVAGQHLRRWKVPVVEVKLPTGQTKEGLANLIAPRFEAHLALIPEYAPWLETWLEEHRAFPYAAHDDMVETTLIAMHYVDRRTEYKPSAEPVSVYNWS